MISITKDFGTFAAAHRQHNHDGHCARLHGHNWGVVVEFSATKLDKNGFVIDFGKMGRFRDALNMLLDHTVLLADDDPQHPAILALGRLSLASIRGLANSSCEGVAREVVQRFMGVIAQDDTLTARGVCVVSVTVHEDEKNSATYYV